MIRWICKYIKSVRKTGDIAEANKSERNTICKLGTNFKYRISDKLWQLWFYNNCTTNVQRIKTKTKVKPKPKTPQYWNIKASNSG